mmetsp:Transcript_10113/g.24543  ORF Transcript_10113/g.24543 Transcript_10113/m.24543 type:complete len:261 (+) Transcript_10113:5052-5834(+)
MDNCQALLLEDPDGFTAACRVDDRSTAVVFVVVVAAWFRQKDNDGGDRCGVMGVRVLVEVRFPVRPLAELVHDEIAKVIRCKSRDLFDPFLDGLLRWRDEVPMPEHDALDAGVVFRLGVELEIIDLVLHQRLNFRFGVFHQRIGLGTRQQIVDQVQGRTHGFDVLEKGSVPTRVQPNSLWHPVVDDVLRFHVGLDRCRRQNVGRIERNHHHRDIDVLRVGFLAYQNFQPEDVVRAILVDVDNHESCRSRELGNLGHLDPA